jgi:hypothetical protein
MATKLSEKIKYLSLNARVKVYLILTLGSLVLFFLGMHQIYPIILNVNEPFGVASSLPVLYWLGLCLLLIACILVYVDHELNNDLLYIFLVFCLGIFMMGIIPFGFAEPHLPNDYYFMAMASKAMATHHVYIEANSPLVAYNSWPAYDFLIVTIRDITSLSSTFFLKYWDIFGDVLIIVVAYAISIQLGMKKNQAFFVSFMALASWLTGFTGCNPRAFGVYLFLIIILLFIKPWKSIVDISLLITVFAALVITHGFETIIALVVIATLSVYMGVFKKERVSLLFPTLLLIFVIFGSWYLYMAFQAFEMGVKQFISFPFEQAASVLNMEHYAVPSVIARSVARYTDLGRVALYMVYVFVGVLMMVRHKLSRETIPGVVAALCWIVGVVPVIVLGYGEELDRAYLFSIIPAAIVVVLTFRNKLQTFMIIILMCLMVVINLPANYATEIAFGEVLSTELAGAKYIAVNIGPENNASIFYSPGSETIWYFNSDLEANIWTPTYTVLSPNQVDLKILDNMYYVILSRQSSEPFLFSWGQDPYSLWPQTEIGQTADLIYNNGAFWVYKNNLPTG